MMNEELLRRGLAHTYLHKLNTRKADQLISAQREAIREGRKLFQEIDETSEQYYRVHSAYRYHRTGCKYVRDIPDRELEVFKSRKEALLRGYNGASCCFRGE